MGVRSASDTNKLLLGITGGIAAYKTPELVRLLKQNGWDVQVVLTEGAKSFVTPLTLEVVSQRAVRDSLWDQKAELSMSHIELARWADCFLIAPASANCLFALAHGQAHDLLSTIALASIVPLVLVPGMNKNMWMHPAVQENVGLLRQRGARLLGPDFGEQACGDIGLGRMVEPAAIVSSLKQTESLTCEREKKLQGVNVMITAGPTREPIDPVRYISNASSGKMGFYLAEVAEEMGANVTLVSGPVNLKTPKGVKRLDVITAEEMAKAVLDNVGLVDIFLGVAAVSDFCCLQASEEKIKKSNVKDNLNLTFKPNLDILQTVAEVPKAPYCVGFALEQAGEALRYAKEKLQAKKINMIAVNHIDKPDQGFESDTNALHVIWETGEKFLPLAHKKEIAYQLWEVICDKFKSS